MMDDPTAKELFSRACRLCGAPLAIVVNGDGKTVALDLAAAVYAPTFKGQCVRTTLSFVDHMAVCKKLA